MSGETFEEVRQELSRRRLLQGMSVAALTAAAQPVLAVAGADAAGAAEGDDDGYNPGVSTGLGFTEVPIGTTDEWVIAKNHVGKVLLAWGDPIHAGDVAKDARTLTPAEQERRFGFNNDYIALVPFPFLNEDRGLLWVNHEVSDGFNMFAGYDAANPKPTLDQVGVELAAHGGTVVEVVKEGGTWKVVLESPYNRRITGTTPITISGPAAGDARLQTSQDSDGTSVLGMFNNCGGGITPWGTILTCEENFNQYFANAGKLTDSKAKATATRLGIGTAVSGKRWENFVDRFDLAKEPNEVNRFGYVVEIDPFEPTLAPRKHTALGRFKHEAATVVMSKAGKPVIYTGDDQAFEYIYKFVGSKAPSRTSRAENRDLLDHGTLYAATFNPDGTGRWNPLTIDVPKLAANFTDQADICIRTREAADLVGATKMDRPEDIETNPVNKRVYIALTNNTSRGVGTNAGTDNVNPRIKNTNGQIVELVEAGGDPASLTFTWSIFLLAGPQTDDTRLFNGHVNPDASDISCPDNLTFDPSGNLWIATDGQPSAIKQNDALFALATTGPDRALPKRFFTAPFGAEVTGPFITPDGRNLFASIQHPGESGTLTSPQSTWPGHTSGYPRPAVVVVTKATGDPRVGSA
jgi:secreted PhoX family phosphatase